MTFRSFLRGLSLMALAVLMSGTTGDPDLWGHVRFGQDMLAARAVRVPETYSFTADRPWVNHEWLSEVAMAASFDSFGAPGLNALRVVIVAGVLALIWLASSRVDDRHRFLIVTAGAVGIFLRALRFRPQVFSLLMFALLLTLLARADDRRSWRPLVLVPLLMAVWVNMHGGWLVGFGVLGLWCALAMRTATFRERIALAMLVMTSAAATLINPYGYGMWDFLAETVRVERPMIADWQPLFGLSPALWAPFVIAAALTVAAAMRMRSLAAHKELVIAAVLGILAVRVSRLDAFFAIVAAFFAARALSEAGIPTPAPSPRPPSTKLAWAFGACSIAAAIVAVPKASTIPMEADSVPDAHVATYVRDQRLQGRMLTFFDWGEYTIWHFGPDLKVSMDGRRETVYSAETVAAHMKFYLNDGDAWRYADTLQPDYVWIPKWLPVANQLRARGWSVLCEGPSSILLTRRPVLAPCVPDSKNTAPSPFPQM